MVPQPPIWTVYALQKVGPRTDAGFFGHATRHAGVKANVFPTLFLLTLFALCSLFSLLTTRQQIQDRRSRRQLHCRPLANQLPCTTPSASPHLSSQSCLTTSPPKCRRRPGTSTSATILTNGSIRSCRTWTSLTGLARRT